MCGELPKGGFKWWDNVIWYGLWQRAVTPADVRVVRLTERWLEKVTKDGTEIRDSDIIHWSTMQLLEVVGLGNWWIGERSSWLLGGLSSLGSLLGDIVTHHIIQNADLLRGISVGKSSFRHNDFFRCLWEDRFVVLGQDYGAGKQHPILSSEITGIAKLPR